MQVRTLTTEHRKEKTLIQQKKRAYRRTQLPPNLQSPLDEF